MAVIFPELLKKNTQLTVMKWYPKVWGPGHQKDENLHTSVLQEVIPTRTGLRRLASTVAVYRVVKAAAVKASPFPSPLTTGTITTPARETAKMRKVDLTVSRPTN